MRLRHPVHHTPADLLVSSGGPSECGRAAAATPDTTPRCHHPRSSAPLEALHADIVSAWGAAAPLARPDADGRFHHVFWKPLGGRCSTRIARGGFCEGVATEEHYAALHSAGAVAIVIDAEVSVMINST